MPDIFGQNPLLPTLPSLPPVTQGAIARLVGMMLIAPKFLGLVSYLCHHGVLRREAPGFAGLVLAKMVVSTLLAPALMVHRSRPSCARPWAGMAAECRMSREGRTL